MSPQRNLGVALGTTLVASVAILLANWHVDPFGLRRAGAEAEAPMEGRAALREPFWHKAFAVAAVKPDAVILGTSRADWALDGAHPGFAESARPGYNLALDGASIDQMRELLVHAQRSHPLRLAVVGLDLEAFTSSGRTDFDPAALAGNKESAPEWLSRMRLSLSWRALGASAGLLGPPSNVWPSIQELGGQRRVFRSSEFNNFQARRAQLFPRWDPRMRWDSDPRRAASIRAFRDLLSFARKEGIALRLFISPVHARYLEAYRRVGWWPMFEAWKLALVAALAEDARMHPEGSAFPLWDFSGFNRVTMEAVPAHDDPEKVMRWYIDSSHYSREHGNLILDRVLGRPRARDYGPDEVGVLIDTRNIETHLRSTLYDAENYRIAFPTDVAEVAAIASHIRRTIRKP